MNEPRIPHLAVVSTYFYPKIGGVENYAYMLAKRLHKSGEYYVSVVTSNASKGYQKEIIDGMTVHRLPVSFKISNTPINFAWHSQIKKIFNEDRPDIIHTHSPVPFMADVAIQIADEEKIPSIATYHSGSMRKGRWPIDLVIMIYESVFLKKMFARANAIVAVSQSFMQREFPQYASKTYFIPTGVDCERFKKTPLPEHMDTVTFVGRIEHNSSWKGVDPLLRATAIVTAHRPDTKLNLVGGGDALPYYRRRAEELGISKSVIMDGPKFGNDLVDAYVKSTVVVLPSTSDSEAFSVSLLEAMASGRPVVGTNIGGTPQVIDDGKNGLLVEPNNPEALASAIEKILEDRTLAERLGDGGAAKAKNFSWDIQTAKYRDLIGKILA